MNKVILLLFISFFLACSNSFIKKPNDLIPEDKMELILKDVFLLNSGKVYNKKLFTENNISFQANILNKHTVDSLQFVESNKYYTYNQDKYLEMLKRIKVDLERERDSIKEVIEKETKKD
jgi:hypothetical protein